MAKICGIDEAGRGAVAGELVVAGCIFKENFENEILSLPLKDSKKLSQDRREKLFSSLEKMSDFLIVYFKNSIIDEIGLSLCLNRALNTIKMHFDGCEFIFDGNCNYGVKNIKTIIKADDKIKQVSGASIIAKVSRDRQMRVFDKIYPAFGYAKHKGYGTKSHLKAIEIYGVSELTRLSFKLKSSKNIKCKA